MYEFKNHGSTHGLPRGDFPFRKLESLACMRFSECPKIITLMMHTSLADTTPIHCYLSGTRKVIDFSVPRQNFISRVSEEGIRFSIVKVIDCQGVTRWLVVSEFNRQGFLLHGHLLNDFGNLVVAQRCKKRGRWQNCYQ